MKLTHEQIEQIVRRIQPNIDLAASGVTWSGASVLAILADPPSTPATDDAYIVSAPATGAWAGQEGAVASWDGAMWVFTVQDDQFIMLVEDVAYMYLYDLDANTWSAVVAAPPSHGNLQGLDAYDHPQYMRRDAYYKQFMFLGG